MFEFALTLIFACQISILLLLIIIIAILSKKRLFLIAYTQKDELEEILAKLKEIKIK
jgi:hypothetical protein